MVVTDYTGIDLEISGGLDNNFYPRSRVASSGWILIFKNIYYEENIIHINLYFGTCIFFLS